MTSTSADAGSPPDRATALAHLMAGRYTVAANEFRALAEAEPHAPNLRYDLGAALAASGDEEGAADAWGSARAIHGLALLRELGVDMDRFVADADYAAETGRGLAANGLPGVAAIALARVLQAKGPEAQILADYAVCLLHQGSVEEACEVLGMAEAGDVARLNPLLMTTYACFDDGGLRRSLLGRQTAADLEAAIAPMPRAPASAGGPLKVGYVPGAAPLDARFLAVIARHDPDAVQAVLLLEEGAEAPEGFTAFSLGGLPDAEAAQAVAAFDLDLLVDLSGPLGGRMGLFAHRPARWQAAWNCDLATTGLRAMDAKLLPAGCFEPDSNILFSEAIRPMGPVLAPWPRVEIAPRTSGRFTFGAFMPPALMTKDVVAALARLIWLQPDSRLMLKHMVMDDPVIQRMLAARFLACGVTRDRLEFRGMAGDDLDQFDFDEVDLALDAQPSMGEGQVLALLARGVPVICANGPTTQGRLAAAPLMALGLRQLIAEDVTQMANLALELAEDRAALSALRGRIEAAFAGSAYNDTAAVARKLESAFLALVGQGAQRSRSFA